MPQAAQTVQERRLLAEKTVRKMENFLDMGRDGKVKLRKARHVIGWMLNTDASRDPVMEVLHRNMALENKNVVIVKTEDGSLGAKVVGKVRSAKSRRSSR